MLKNVTTLYDNCNSSQIILHSISNPELNQLTQKYYTLRKQAFELEITEDIILWTSFIRKLLFAWSYSPLSFEVSSIGEIKFEYDRIGELWQHRKDNFQESIKTGIDEILTAIHCLSASN